MGEYYFRLSYHLITLLLCSCEDLDLLTILKVLFLLRTSGLVLLTRVSFNLLHFEEYRRLIRPIFYIRPYLPLGMAKKFYYFCRSRFLIILCFLLLSFILNWELKEDTYCD